MKTRAESAKVRRFVTKYALTRGVSTRVGVVTEGGYFYFGEFPECPTQVHREDHFATYEEALVRAKSVRDRKVILLEKQLTKLRTATFPNPAEK